MEERKMQYRILATVVLLAGLAAMTAQSSRTHTMAVQTSQTDLRSAPNYFSAVLGQLAYTDTVEVLGTQAGWSQVRDAEGREGWVHGSALTRKTLTLAATGEAVGTGVTTEEQALAGKGFNPQVEAEFRERNREANYAAVDAMEQRRVTPQASMAFLAEGGITPTEGGAK